MKGPAAQARGSRSSAGGGPRKSGAGGQCRLPGRGCAPVAHPHLPALWALSWPTLAAHRLLLLSPTPPDTRHPCRPRPSLPVPPAGPSLAHRESSWQPAFQGAQRCRGHLCCGLAQPDGRAGACPSKCPVSAPPLPCLLGVWHAGRGRRKGRRRDHGGTEGEPLARRPLDRACLSLVLEGRRSGQPLVCWPAPAS